ncbi:MAG TPA: hypothetical protein VNN18_06665 [Candidatus Xenobia bacterium]|nr:hypothetical protein [Candidatus Xenobia bacterium]
MSEGRRAAATFWLDSLLIFFLTCWLVWPLFQATYLDKWASIESTFIADARFLNENWPHPGWQPLWYCGTRYDYIYPPALRYGTALIVRWGDVPPARAYHIYVALLYALGIAGVYIFVRTASGSRGLAWLAAAASALLSPSFLVLSGVRADAGELLIPQRLGVLVRYGEGPHMSALALLPLALAACWRAVERFHPAALAAAGVLSALVVSHNFYGAVGLAVLFPVLVFSLSITSDDWRPWLRGAGIAALAYGLTAFWLVPSYIRVTLDNLRYVSRPAKLSSIALLVVVVIVLVLAARLLASGRRERAYGVFACGAACLMALLVIGGILYDFRVAGEMGRLVPELDLAMILLAALGVRWLWLRDGQHRVYWRTAAVMIVLVCFAPARNYVRHPWALFVEDPNYEQRVEYRITKWMHENLPESRALAAGSVRFWYNAWFDLPQVGGGSDQGQMHPFVAPAQWEILLAENPEPSVQWLQAVGADAVIVNDKSSQEVYHDFVFPKKFAGVLPVLYDDRLGNVIYRVPRRYPGLARVVETRVAAALLPPRGNTDTERIAAYADLLEKGPDSPATMRWVSSDEVRVQARLNAGESVVLQVTYDAAWRAYSGSERLAIEKDAMGFMRIAAPPGEHEIRVVFETPLENWIGRVVSALSGIVVVVLLAWSWRRQELPAAAA